MNDMVRLFDDIRADLADVESRVRKLEIDLTHVPNKIESYELRIKGLEIFKAQVLILATAGSVMGGILANIVEKIWLR